LDRGSRSQVSWGLVGRPGREGDFRADSGRRMKGSRGDGMHKQSDAIAMLTGSA
jgi:hypothetical protein